jgi:hypothetical protein
MSLWDKIITQNEIDKSFKRFILKNFKGQKKRKGRNLKDGIVDVGTLPYLEKTPPDANTKEMISDYQKSLTEPLKDSITGNQ